MRNADYVLYFIYCKVPLIIIWFLKLYNFEIQKIIKLILKHSHTVSGFPSLRSVRERIKRRRPRVSEKKRKRQKRERQRYKQRERVGERQVEKIEKGVREQNKLKTEREKSEREREDQREKIERARQREKEIYAQFRFLVSF